MPGLGVPSHCQEILEDISDLALYETTRDYLVNRQFRRDIYVKGKRQMTVAEIADRLDEYSFIALGNREELPLSLATSAGSATLRGDIRSEEHTSELQSLMRISYAVFCLKKKKITSPNVVSQQHQERTTNKL